MDRLEASAVVEGEGGKEERRGRNKTAMAVCVFGVGRRGGGDCWRWYVVDASCRNGVRRDASLVVTIRREVCVQAVGGCVLVRWYRECG